MERGRRSWGTTFDPKFFLLIAWLGWWCLWPGETSPTFWSLLAVKRGKPPKVLLWDLSQCSSVPPPLRTETGRSGRWEGSEQQPVMRSNLLKLLQNDTCRSGTETLHCSWFDCSLLNKFHKIHIKSSPGAENGRNELVIFWHRISQPFSLAPSPLHKKRRKKRKPTTTTKKVAKPEGVKPEMFFQIM